MAINTQKFLPSSKGGALVSLKKSVINISKSSSSSSILSQKSLEDISVIKVKVIEIDNILKGTLAAEKKKLNDTKKQESSKRREKIEEKLETKPKAETGKVKMPSLPRMGFLDWVKNFIGNVILGYFAVRLVDHLPKIIPIVKFLGKATDFVLDLGGKLLDGLVTFVDWGYKAYDATRGFVKNLFGNDGVKQFDQLSSALNQFLNLAIIAGMATAGAGGFGGGKGRGAAGARPRPGTRGRPRVTTSGGARAGGIDLRNPLRERPRVTTGVGGKPQFRLPGTAARVTASAEKRTLLSSARPFLKRIPIPVIGALIDFGLSWALGENPGRAAFRAIGAGILGTIGGGLAGALGLAGGPLAVATAALGSIAGGTLGDIAGGALYDLFFGGKKLSGKSGKYAGGGVTSRSGRPQRGIRRTISKKKRYKRRLAPQKPGKVEANSPGSDVGGEQKLFGLFPNPFKMFQKAADVMNPFGVIKKAGQNLGESDYFGPILSITSKILLGQKPTQQDYKNVGLGINMLVAKGIDDGKLKGGLAAFAEGGFVDPKTLDAIAQGGDISDWVSKSFKDATDTNAQKTLKEIQDNLRLKKDAEVQPDEKKQTQFDENGEPLPGATSGRWGPILDLISKTEGGYDSVNPSLKRPQILGMTINELVSFQKQSIRQNGGTAAVGRYQFLYPESAAKLAGISLNEKFTKENQDKMAVAYLEKKRRGASWLAGKITDEQFMQDLADEWASLPNSQGRFSYSGQSSGTTPKMVKEALAKVRKGGYSSAELSRGSRGQMRLDRGGVGGSIAEYITGDPNTPFGRFDRGGHGLPSNYHDHIAFRDRNTAVNAYKFFQSKGIQVTEFKGFGPVGGHASGSYHYSGLAFDVPGAQWGGSGAIGSKDYAGSAKVRATLKQFLGGGGLTKLERGGRVGGPTKALIGEKGTEFVFDADTTRGLDSIAPGLVEKLNIAKTKSQIADILQSYASYESGAEQTIIVAGQSTAGMENGYESDFGGGVLMMLGGGEESDPFDILYQGG